MRPKERQAHPPMLEIFIVLNEKGRGKKQGNGEGGRKGGRVGGIHTFFFAFFFGKRKK